MKFLQPLCLSVIALATSAVAVKTFLPTPTIQAPNQRWEYRQLEVDATFEDAVDAEWARSSSPLIRASTDRSDKHYEFNTAQLTGLGKQGWELVGVVPANETAHPNYGNDEYVTGLQPNVRPGSVTLLFKRPMAAAQAKLAARSTP